jgi:hypothetical protein
MTILIATFALVFFRALQQLNVTGGHYIAAGVTSYAIACAEVSVILLAIRLGWWSIPWMGTGGAIGVMLAMSMHARTIGRRRVAAQTHGANND